MVSLYHLNAAIKELQSQSIEEIAETVVELRDKIFKLEERVEELEYQQKEEYPDD